MLMIVAVILTAMFVVSYESHRITFDKYHNHEEMTKYLKQIIDEFSNISSLYSIGKSVLSTYTTYISY